MRKFSSLFVTAMLCSFIVFAQTRTVTGSVKDNKGEAISFATITETGTKNAVNADAAGSFVIKIKTGATITVTATGHKSQTLTPTAGFQSISLDIITGEISEVVVTTAFGIKRRPKEVGYANTTLKGEQLTIGKSPTLGQALSGKVAGLQVFNTNQAVNSQPRIVLRGNRSITGENQALIVLDGVPVPSNTLSYLNPNDVENITVLKGGQGATLFGSDGANGVIVINTKKGANAKPQVSVTSTVNMDVISFLPKFQTEFGSGSGYGLTQKENYRPFENQQYGDPFDGSIRAVGRKQEDGTYLELPYSFIPGIRKSIWDKGVTTQNDVSISGGDATSTYYLSIQDVNIKGVVPKDELRRDAFRFNASKTYGKFKTSFDATYAIDRTQRSDADFYFYSLNSPGWVPIDKLQDWKTDKFANPNGYFNDYYNNPWFELDNNRSDSRNNYFNGNLTFNFKPVSWIDINYRLGTAVTNSSFKSWTNRFDYTDYAKGLLADKPITKDPQYNDYSYNWRARNSPVTGDIQDGLSYGTRITSDLFVTLNKRFGDFSTKLILGNSIQQRQSKQVNVSSTSVIIPELYNVGNRSGELGGGESNATQRKAGNFADLTVGYKDYLFVHGTVRVDQSSVYFDKNRASSLYTYPWYGGDISLIVTELFPSLKSNALNYLKIRGGLNKNGNDNLGAYSLIPTFSPGGGFPYGSIVGITVNNNYPDLKLGPEFFFTQEVGFEATFWKNKLNLDVSYYKTQANNQVLGQSISSSTGYTQTTLNAARVSTYGLEAEARANVYKKKDWSVDVNANFTYKTNAVKELIGGLDRIQLNGAGGYSFIYAEINKPFPYLKVTHWATDPATGKTIINPDNGWPKIATGADALKGMGTTDPKYQVGTGLRVSYKFITLAANAEFRGGYVVFSNLGNTMAFTGSSAATTIYHRQPFIWPNSVYDDGTKFVPNTNIPTENFLSIYGGWGDYGFSNGAVNNGEYFTSSGNFWKIRDASLTFNCPAKWIQKLKTVKSASLAVWGRNLYTWLAKDNWYTDPEFSNTNGNGIGINVTGNTPPSRQYGATLNVNF